MKLFGLRGVTGKELSSEASFKGWNGSFVTDLDAFYESNVGAENDSNVISSVIEIVSKVARIDVELDVDGEKKKDRITYLLNEKPNKYESAYDFKFRVLSESIMKGNSYIEIVRNGREVKELRRLSFDSVNVIVVYSKGLDYVEDVYYYISLGEEGDLKGTEDLDDLRDNVDEGYGRLLGTEEVLHLKPFNIGDDMVGISLLDYLESDIQLEQDSKNFIRQFMQTGGNTGGNISVKTDGNMMNSETKSYIRNEFVKSMSNYTGITVTDDMVQFTPKDVSDKVISSLIENKTTASKFAQMFGMPLHKLGVATSNMSLSALDHEFRNGTLAIYLKMMETEFTDKFYRVQGDYESKLKYDLNSISLLSMEEKIELVGVLNRTGAGTLNEIRDILGLDRKDSEALDKHRVDLNRIDIEIAGEYQLGKTDLEEGGEVGEGV